ncbi:MAG: protease modulator HflK [Gemmataceae bacterium]|nr:protease modulator HflK [Gemmataceae bacterium]
MFRYALYFVGLIFLVWTAATSLTQVQSHERAVIRRFGRILDYKPQPGLYIGLPWGIDRVDLAPVRSARSIVVGFNEKAETDDETIPAGQMLTGDHNLVNVQASIAYRVREQDMENYVLQKDQVDAFVARAVESLLAEWIAANTVNDVTRHGKNQLPEFLQQRLPDRLNAYQLGIEIERASIPMLDTPKQVKAAFEMVGQAQTGIGTKVNQAKQDAASRRSVAKAEEFKIDREAKSYAREQRIKALADADSFNKRLVQYRDFSAKNPDYLNALWLDEITGLFKKMRDGGRIDVLDLTSELNITQFPPQPKKK